MGLQFHKRTRGKNAWLNFSLSERNGFNSSVSFKFGPFTSNFGPKGRRRVTVNLGNGLKYVKTSNAWKDAENKDRELMKRWNQRVERKAIEEANSTPRPELTPEEKRRFFWVFCGITAVVCFIIQLLIR